MITELFRCSNHNIDAEIVASSARAEIHYKCMENYSQFGRAENSSPCWNIFPVNENSFLLTFVKTEDGLKFAM